LNPIPKSLDKEIPEIQNSVHPQKMENEKNIEVKVVEDLKKWIEYVSQARTELGGFSICPFAEKANYKIIFCNVNLIQPEDNYDVIIYVIQEENLEVINEWVKKYNQKYSDWLFFEDCASYDTYLNEVQTNNGKYNLILGQPKNKLRKFREILKKTKYYSFWSKEYYDEIMSSDDES